MKITINKLGAIAALFILLGAMACSTAPTPPPRPAVDIEPEKYSYKNGSLWPGKAKKNMFFADNKASRVGDIVTVQVIEKTTAANKANTSESSDTSDSLSIDTGGATATTMALGGGKSYTGKGSTDRSDQFSATVSCIVTEILGNGNMIVEGQKRMTINNEEQYIMVRGTVRPEDIKFNNSVISTKLADVDISYTGGGGIDRSKGPGWGGSFLRKVWPF